MKGSAFKIVVLASGGGSNLQSIIDAVAQGVLSNVFISKLICDRPCGALKRAEDAGIMSHQLERGPQISKQIDALLDVDTNLIVLAGFLSILDGPFCDKWATKIINLHPSILPKFGGAGMYGKHVHRAVLRAKETQSGTTIHFVTQEIDAGAIIAQRKCPVYLDDTPQSLSQRVNKLENKLIVEVIAMLNKRNPE